MLTDKFVDNILQAPLDDEKFMATSIRFCRLRPIFLFRGELMIGANLFCLLLIKNYHFGHLHEK